jgi:hypothetical protein
METAKLLPVRTVFPPQHFRRFDHHTQMLANTYLGTVHVSSRLTSNLTPEIAGRSQWISLINIQTA